MFLSAVFVSDPTRNCVCSYLLFELRFLFLHQLTLPPGLCGVLQQLIYHSTVSSTALTGTAHTSSAGYLPLTTRRDHKKKNRHRRCTHKVSLSLLLLLHFFHHLSNSLQFGIHQLLLQLLVLEHFVYVLRGRYSRDSLYCEQL